MRHERRNAVPGPALEVERRIGKVTQHGAGRGVLPGAASVVKRVANDIAADINRIENIIDAREHVRVRDECWINGDLDRCAAIRSSLCSPGVFSFLYDAKQLDGVAQLSGELDVEF